VVDDVDEIRVLVQRALSAQGYQVDVAATLAEAFGMEPSGYNAVLVDAHLGAERGTELVEALRSDDPAAVGRCLVLTGGSADEIPEGVAWLAKPFRTDELVDAVRALDHPHSAPARSGLPAPAPDARAQPAPPGALQPSGTEPRTWELLGLARRLRAHERGELVDFLHDGPIQELTALNLDLQMMSRSAPEDAAPGLGAVMRRLNAVAESLRWLIDGNWPFHAPEIRLATAIQQRTEWLLAAPAAVDTMDADGEADGLGPAAVPVIVDIIEIMLMGLVPAGPPVRARVGVRARDPVIEIELTLTPAAEDHQVIAPAAAQAALDELASALGASAHVSLSGQQLDARISLRRGAAPDPQSLARPDKSAAQLRQAQRLESLGQLAGGVAHDFNNLLAVILNYASFISEELTASSPDWIHHRDAALADLRQITLAGERAARLTRQLLAFSRREVTRPQVIYLGAVITGITEMLRRTLGENVELVTSFADDLWPVLADPAQLEQLLVNLAVNARDAMPDGGTLIIEAGNINVDAESVAGGSTSRQGKNVRLRVSDTGTGMSQEVIEHAFEPFFTTKDNGTGTGLGLATVYGILTQAEGNVHIYSEVGVGTTFSITLPVTAESPRPIAEPVHYHRTPTGETVLVVEDASPLREVTRRIFARAGYHVITAANGPEALTLARAHPGEIHLLVTDVVMPHMLGKEVAEKIQEIKPGIAVLYMSGYARPVLASQGRLEPGVALVEKPFSRADLLTKAREVLNGHFPGFGNRRSPA
jgi:signal transduction histidine kinase/DNA-binding response OmpR family regulator